MDRSSPHAPAPHAPASETVDAAYAALETALTRTTDARAGFETMVDRAEPSFRPVAERFRALHARHAERLARMLTDAGRAPDTDGSLMGTVNRAVVATRAMFDEIDADVVPQIVSGESHVLDAYRDALDAPLPAPEHEALASLLAELQAALEEARHRA